MDRIDEAVVSAMDARRRSYGRTTLGSKEAQDFEAMRAALLAGMKVLLGEPVAWMCDAGDGINCDATASIHVRDTYAKVGRTVTPLYAPSLGEGHE